MTDGDNHDSFADAPVSINELRSDRSQNATDWAPRDVLVSMLREIDAGRLGNITNLLVALTVTDERGTYTTYQSSSPSINHTLGTIEHAKWKMMRDAYSPVD